jgi:hypothetical protein
VALGIGGGFVTVGVLGFLPEVTSDHDLLSWTDHHTGTKLFGLLELSVVRNIEHLLLGVAGLVMARTGCGARRFLIGGGVIYTGVWAYGLISDLYSTAPDIGVNTADNWIHLSVGIAMILLGLPSVAGAGSSRLRP